MHSKYLETNNTVSIQGLLCRMVLVVNFFKFLKLIFFALLLLFVTWCMMSGGYISPSLTANNIWKPFLKY